jgi:hypothetical protein
MAVCFMLRPQTSEMAGNRLGDVGLEICFGMLPELKLVSLFEVEAAVLYSSSVYQQSWDLPGKRPLGQV